MAQIIPGPIINYLKATNVYFSATKIDVQPPIFSSPGRSSGRAIVLPPASAAVSALTKC